MRLKKYEDMNLQELDVMKEISSIGTSHGSVQTPSKGDQDLDSGDQYSGV